MILVTGASGRIGQKLVRALAKQAELRVLIRDQTPSPFSDLAEVRVVRGDIADSAAVERACEGATEVIHLAAAMHGSEGEYVAGTLRGTENVIRSCLAKRVDKLLYMSSLSVLALSTLPYEVNVDESWDYESLPQRRGYYTQYKLLAEQRILDAVRQQGLRACILRPAEVLQRDRPHLSFATGIKAGPFTVSLVDKQANVPLVELDDLVAITLRLLDVCPFRGEIIHIVDPLVVSQSEYLAAFRKVTGGQGWVLKIPLGIPLTLARGLDLVSKLSGFSFPISVHRFRSAIGPRRFSTETLLRYLGPWEFTGVQSYLNTTSGLESAPSRDANVSS